jgi:hypothetical protein
VVGEIASDDARHDSAPPMTGNLCGAIERGPSVACSRLRVCLWSKHPPPTACCDEIDPALERVGYCVDKMVVTEVFEVIHAAFEGDRVDDVAAGCRDGRDRTSTA